MLLSEYLKLSKKTPRQAAAELDVSIMTINRMCRGLMYQNCNIRKVYEWSNGVVTPNDFYNIKQEK